MEVKSSDPLCLDAAAGDADLPESLPALLERSTAAHRDAVFLPRRSATAKGPVTFSDLWRDVERLSAGLCSLGLSRGDRAALLAENRYEWLLCDLAVACVGAIDVPRGSDTAPSEIRFILEHSGAALAFVENDETARAVLSQRNELPALAHVIVMADSTSVEGARSMEDVAKAGARWIEDHRAELDQRRAAVSRDDLLTIVYTSGTTANPKGVMLTHGNVLSNIRDCRTVLGISHEDSFLSVLPAWHMYERIMDYLALAAGSRLVYTDRRRFKQDLENESPTVFAAVPRIWEAIHDGIVARAHKLGGIKGRLLRGEIALAREVAGGRAGPFARLLHRFLSPMVVPRIKASTGGRLRLGVSGGGALPRHVDETLLGLGVPLKNGYGLTETSPVVAVRRPDDHRPGTIGQALPHTEGEARDERKRRLPPGETGVLFVRGPQVMRGYYRNERKTAEVLDRNGWLDTGDLGRVDPDGSIWITGRAKDTIVLAGGENVEPEPVEAAIKTSPWIEQAVLVGQDKKLLGVLLVPSAETLKERIPEERWGGDGRLLHGKEILDLFRAEIDRLVTRKSGFRPFERPAALRVLAEPMTPENGLLTRTLKIRRHKVAERYADVIDEMLR
ncbi:MAG: AMP-binding protein [Planctomycetota bacterium]